MCFISKAPPGKHESDFEELLREFQNALVSWASGRVQIFYSELLTNRLAKYHRTENIKWTNNGCCRQASCWNIAKSFFSFQFCLPSSFLGFPFKFSIKKKKYRSVSVSRERMKAQQTSNTAEDSNGAWVDGISVKWITYVTQISIIFLREISPGRRARKCFWVRFWF